MDWAQRLAVLADQLSAEGKLTSPQWRGVFCAVPRHELVPEIYLQDEHGQWRPAEAGTAQWWDLVYSDTTVITSVLPNSQGILVPVSSSTKPGLMLRMLEALDIRDGMRVLEIGTGSGYNAGLLSARLGVQHVFSVDLRPELVELARDRLARLGYRPMLAARDGTEGLAEHAPYDRIIVTCGMPFIPAAWITQLAPGGLLLVDLEGPLSAGNLIALRRDTDV
ncbi:MAG: methyltransferase domain-containing protein, partial [Pseudonocardiaceae bacterium]